MHIAPLFSAQHHPIVITPDADNSLAALSANPDQLHQLLLHHGGILFRGFQVQSPEHFNTAVAALGAQAYAYVGGNSPRTRVLQDVFTSTEYPASEVISLHNEMSYLPGWPRRLFFYSQVPAQTGGQTSLANSADVLQAMPEHIVQTFEQKKIRYLRYFPSDIKLGKSWQATYQTQEREEVEALVRAQGSTCEWKTNGTLEVSTVCEALCRHPETGVLGWFNQAEQWHPSALHPDVRKMFESRNMLAHHCAHGDGSALDETMLATIRQVINQNKLLFNWQKNDMLMIDNVLMMHGRESFKGTRKTLAFLSGT